MTDIGIVDLGMGNLRSVANAIASLGNDARLVRSPVEMEGLTHVVLPGVGAFAQAMETMRRQELTEPLRAAAAAGLPILGICLGMQLLATEGDEGGTSEGLGLVPGRVVRFDAGAVPAIPHVGWNEVRLASAHPVFRKVKTGADFYFVHSYHVVCDDPRHAVGDVEYGGTRYTSVIGRDNVLGFQFHPEKSQASGLRLLENFCDWDGRC